MKFIFADSLDTIDPKYNFLEDRFNPKREVYWDDLYPHQVLKRSPYDGILISRAVIGRPGASGQYNQVLAMRFRRVGARAFLRFSEKEYPESMIIGDCGAFAYSNEEIPPYSVEDMIDFYGDGQFTHGASVDHIIFDFVDDDKVSTINEDAKNENQRRYDLTLNNAEAFLKSSEYLGNGFVPLGVVQGWSPTSMAQAALKLKKMGYSYIAIGGMVPLNDAQIEKALTKIREYVGGDMRIHLLGFAKANTIQNYSKYNITSFDTTSPFIKSFKDDRHNYFSFEDCIGDHYTAIRVPQSTVNNKLKNLAKEGIYQQEDLQKREQEALGKLRAFDKNNATLDDTLNAVMAYANPIVVGNEGEPTTSQNNTLTKLKDAYTRTLNEKPWKKCACTICSEVGIEVIIYRASNRNKRRGFHNLYSYRNHLDNIGITKRYE
jgi:hypothetical protein